MKILTLTLLLINFSICSWINTNSEKSIDVDVDPVKLFHKADSQYTNSLYLFDKIDSISIPNKTDSLEIYLPINVSSGYLWQQDTLYSNVHSKEPKFESIEIKDQEQNFVIFSFINFDTNSEINLKFQLRRPFDSEGVLKDSCILTIYPSK